jgi:AcrR family transcriptional regulator
MDKPARQRARSSPPEDIAAGVSAGRLRILQAAVDTFIRDGGAAFTARGVAKKAGMPRSS